MFLNSAQEYCQGKLVITTKPEGIFQTPGWHRFSRVNFIVLQRCNQNRIVFTFNQKM